MLAILKCTILFVIVFGSLVASSQPNHEAGILIFEGQQDVFGLYFIRTSSKYLVSELNKHDTIIAVIIGAPGDNAAATDSFKEYLQQTIKFDTLSLIINQRNYLGQEYEDSSLLLSKHGNIQYKQNMRYKVGKRHKKIYLNNRVIIMKIDEYVSIESFTAKSLKVR